MLVAVSEVFRDLFSLPVPQEEDQREGSHDDKPIYLSGFSAHEFNQFLFWMYPSL